MVQVSVIIPAYNHGRFIASAVDSVLNQTFRDYEIIVVDDGSCDNTTDALRPYLHLITYLYKANGGASSAVNKGIRYSSGRWICWLSADDLFVPSKLSEQLKKAETDEQIGLVYSSFYEIDEFGRILKEQFSGQCGSRKDWAQMLLRFCFINGSTTMIRRDLLYRAGLFDETIVFAHDYDLWLRLLPYCKFAFCPEPLIHYRKHQNTATCRINEAIHQAELSKIRRRALALYKKTGVMP